MCLFSERRIKFGYGTVRRCRRRRCRDLHVALGGGLDGGWSGGQWLCHRFSSAAGLHGIWTWEHGSKVNLGSNGSKNEELRHLKMFSLGNPWEASEVKADGCGMVLLLGCY